VQLHGVIILADPEVHTPLLDRWIGEWKKKRAEEALVTVPVLGTLAEIEEIARTHQPEYPILGVDNAIPIRLIGKALFGPDGYNKLYQGKGSNDTGPHFDGTARNCTPWAIHKNKDSVGLFKATFLPEDVWSRYLERTVNMMINDDDEMSRRKATGRGVMQTAKNVVRRDIGPGSLTLIWNGQTDRDFTPPSVHDVTREPKAADYGFSVYVRDRIGMPMEGFEDV